MLAIISILSRCFVVFCCLPIHEYAHCLAAHLLGDDTAKNQGRLTLNPFAHLNPIGTVMIFLFGIGYGNPAPINPNNFKKPKQGMALTALAGPCANLILTFILSDILQVQVRREVLFRISFCLRLRLILCLPYSIYFRFLRLTAQGCSEGFCLIKHFINI